ncbi:alginate export family protein [Oceanobacter mangrovi]|uniref:alginate export family protein n=1 Tax=Oceanobacter mangrovi TaxID=2862510 RepID=UPI001C8EEDF6|nr:alginate export family protein [Oceanobacter mangrovi]
MFRKSLLLTAVALASSQPGVVSASIMDAIEGGKMLLDVRLRYETNDTEGGTDAATALTLRSRIGYESDNYQGFKLLLENEMVHAFIDDYQALDNRYDPVADPVGNEINRAQISYNSDDLDAVVGRQRIILDNARFVGNVGWRQNEQTYDAIKLNYRINNVSLTYAYLDQVNGILFQEVDVTDHLLNVAWKASDAFTLTGFGYLLKNDDTDAKDDTLGASVNGKVSGLMYSASYAQQSTDKFDASYLALELGTTMGAAKVFVGHEVLGSDDGNYGFQTSLATKHAFNGWADKFLTTPTSGLTDTYLKAVGTIKGIKLLGMYHEFGADEGGADLGSELDLLVSKNIGKTAAVGIKSAMYSKGDTGTDTDKMWLWAQKKF